MGRAASNQTLFQLSSDQLASIDLPLSLFEQITNHSLIGLFYGLYSDPTLFPVGVQDSKLTEIVSPVLATTVGPNINFENLQDPVTVLLRIKKTDQKVIQQLVDSTLL